MIKRIAIFPSYGGCGVPEEFKAVINNSSRSWRLVAAELIDSLKDTHSEIDEDVYTEFLHKPFSKNNWYLKCGNNFYFKTEEESSFVFRLKIVEVDTSKKWKIDEYDGAEGIEYFREPVLVDKELNMYRW